jgi:citrate synthase
MRVFWRDQPLDAVEAELLKRCLEAHAESALRPNVSTQVLQMAAGGSGDYTKSLVAALSTVGGMHAPLEETYHFLLAQDEVTELTPGMQLPGWGSSFEKDGCDPLWLGVQEQLFKHYLKLKGRIESVTAALHALGKKIYPNASCYTAATGIAIGLPSNCLAWLFVQGRLENWTMICAKQFGLIPSTNN